MAAERAEEAILRRLLDPADPLKHGGSVTAKEAGLEDLVKRAATLKDQRTRIRAAIKQLAGDAVTLGWKFWSETMLAGLTHRARSTFARSLEAIPIFLFFPRVM